MEAVSEGSYSALMKGRRAEMVFADPPYHDPIDGDATGFGNFHGPEFAVAPGEMNPSEFTAFLTTIFAQLAQNAVDGALHFICMDWGHSVELRSAARSVYAEFKHLCVWVKDNAGGVLSPARWNAVRTPATALGRGLTDISQA